MEITRGVWKEWRFTLMWLLKKMTAHLGASRRPEHSTAGVRLNH
jgi:hypothetical protein